VAQGAIEPHAAPGAAVARSGGSGHADLAHGSSHAVVSYNPDAPSEDWGWHGHWRAFAPKSSRFLLWLGVALLLCLNLTTHQSHVESWYYNGIAILMAAWLVAREASFRRARRRARPPVGD
jgi:hypothetical protein